MEKLGRQASDFYAHVFGPAKAGCLNYLRQAGCSEDRAEDVFSDALGEVIGKVDPIARNFAEAEMVNFLKRACRNQLISQWRR